MCNLHQQQPRVRSEGGRRARARPAPISRVATATGSASIHEQNQSTLFLEFGCSRIIVWGE